ncbi:zinc metallopeptidase [Acetobacterium bakii]|uniref:Zinc metallopeptidase n=1 Tax=Acetobacterium bakii TaxID=52689 RepID=A0A0L6TYK5_9FIRM|nr:zinc metallopeptidase [Acetobacterium bakii]KNZ41177.1 zinc metallopeptidase [Acetobacterium bakii]
MFFSQYYLSFLILIPGLIFAAYAQYQVSSAYKTYSKVPTKTGITGADAARAILNNNDLKNVGIEDIAGNLTDHYDPRGKVMRLSQGVSQKASIAAVGIAAHETGHALQDKDGYWPLHFRNFIVPVSGFASNLAWPIFFIGLLFGQSGWGVTFMNLGILLFCLALLFTVITLPVEFNASSRAVKTLVENHIIQPGEEVGVKKVLRAAALTYVAAALMALLNLVRLLILRGRN